MILFLFFLLRLNFAISFINKDDLILDRMKRFEHKAHSLHHTNNILSPASFSIIKDDFLLNDDTADGARQQKPSIVINRYGNTVVCWSDFRDGNADVYCQRFDNNSNPVEENFRVNTDGGMSWQGEPSVAIDQPGNFIVAWEDRRVYNSDVYVQRFNQQGIAIDTNFRVNDNTGTSDQRDACVLILPSKDFIIVWDDWRNDWGDIYAQRYDSIGNRIGINFKVNDDPSGSNQYCPSISQDSLGNFVITWMDGRTGDWDIYAQRFNNQGQRLGANFQVNDANSAFQGYPKTVCSPNGQFIIVWEDQRSGNSDIYCQRFNNTGNRIGSNFKVNNDVGSSSQSSANIANDTSGNFIITWQDNRSGNYDVFCQRYNNNGSTIGQNFKVNNDVTFQNQFSPSIAIKTDGSFWVVWDDERNINEDIYYQLYNNDGSPNGINHKLNNDIASSMQRCSWITQSGFGNYTVVWEDERNSNTDIYGVCFDSLGNFLGSNFRINDDGNNFDHFYASVTSNFNGDFTAVWTDGRNNSFDIFAQRCANTGNPLGQNFRINNDTAGTQWYPVISSDSIGNCAIAWMDYRNNNPDIYCRLYDNQGNQLGNNFIVNDVSTGSHMYPFLTRNRHGDFIVAWMDDRNGNFDIYAQRFDYNGYLIGANFKVNDDNTSAAQGYPAVSIDLSGNFSIVWEDSRDENTNIYMQRYNSNGIPIDTNFRVDDDTSESDQYSPTIAYDPTGRQVVVWCDYRKEDDDLEIYAQAFQNNGVRLGVNRQINQPDLFPANNQWLIGQGVICNSSRIGFAWIDNRRHQGWDIYSKITDWDFMAGIEQSSAQMNLNPNPIQLFPNPSHGSIYATSNQINHYNIEVFNSLGKKITTITPATNLPKFSKLLINLNKFSSGIYFIKFSNGIINETKKIILY
jgi:hypothetical protein